MSLSPKFIYIFVAIEELKNLSTHTQNELMGLLIVHVENMKKVPKKSLEEAF